MDAKQSRETRSHRIAARRSTTTIGILATLPALLRAKGTGAPSQPARRRSRRGRLALVALTAIAAFGLLAVAPALAAPVWNLEMHHNPTNFSSAEPGALGVETATDGSATANEVQEVVLTAESGKFTLSFEGDSTPELEYNTGAAQLQTALRSLPSIGAPNVKVARQVNGAKTTYTVTFEGTLAKTDVPQILAAQGTPQLGLTAHPQYWFALDNVGPSASSGPIKLTVELPAGLTSAKVILGEEQISGPALKWHCSGETGATTVQCETESGSIPRHTLAYLILEVVVQTGLPEKDLLTATATLSGGGAEKAATDSEPTPVLSDSAGFGVAADFGIVESSFTPDFFAADGTTTERQAGAHPDLLTVPVDFNSRPAPTASKPALDRASGSIRDLSVELPPGFLGNPTAVGECTAAQYTLSQCPRSSQVGRFDGSVYPLGLGLAWNFSVGVFNIVHPRGTVTDLGFSVAGNPVHVKASLDPEDHYAITTTLADINESAPPFGGKVTIWGIPADPSHDSERCQAFAGAGGAVSSTEEECPAGHPVKPFVTMPFRCEVENTFALREYDSWQEKGAFGPEIPYTNPGRLHGCDRVPFEPGVSVAPTTDAAESPSGLDVTVDLPQHEECAQIEPAPPKGETQYECETATSPLRDATVALPKGIAVNPAGANGLEACSEAQISLGTNEPVGCPSGSQVASVEVTTPALPDPVEGVVYLATPYRNPAGTLLAGYIVLEEPSRGILIKVPGRISVDPATGQLTGSFEENPQLPFSKLELHFKAGAHSTLITPPTCGEYTAQADFTPWSGNAAVHPSSSFAITKSASGGACASQPNSPSLDAGPVSPLAGHYSPFTLDLSREDGTQRFSSVTISPPPGLTAKLAGTATCPDSALAAAEAQDRPRRAGSSPPARGLRRSAPSTSAPAPAPPPTGPRAPPTSPAPTRAPRSRWRSSPRRSPVPSTSAPSSSAPPSTSTPKPPASPRSRDPLPTILEGHPARHQARSRLTSTDRTSPSTRPAATRWRSTGSRLSTQGQSAPLSQRFQVGECGRLAFKPKLAISLKGGTKRTGHPALTATVTYPKGGATPTSPAPGRPAALRVPRPGPHRHGLHPGAVRRRKRARRRCPVYGIYGHARAITPLLDQPLEGPVYLQILQPPAPRPGRCPKRPDPGRPRRHDRLRQGRASATPSKSSPTPRSPSSSSRCRAARRGYWSTAPISASRPTRPSPSSSLKTAGPMTPNRW